ncbi:MAG TPA: SRPBCC family protein [Xanthomonadales bacterium]|nr:SRPBCC family protein [Xanthomonadales bacterium]
MDVNLRATRRFRAPPAAVFALALDPVRFPATFRGYGPIPAIRSIALHAPPAVGATRELDNSDGSRPRERITALERDRRHAYVLSNLAAPFSWLVRAGHADWTFGAEGEGTAVEWRYRFELTSPLAWPLAAPLLHAFFAPAMRRCLAAMAVTLESAPEPA